MLFPKDIFKVHRIQVILELTLLKRLSVFLNGSRYPISNKFMHSVIYEG